MKMATLEKAIVIGRLGRLNSSEIRQMNENLICLFQLKN